MQNYHSFILQWTFSGPTCRKPSEIVEKILQALKEREKDLQRKNSAQSWTTASSSDNSGIPSRFTLVDPHRPTLDSIVNNLPKSRVLSKDQISLKFAAQSVLRTKNREWMLQQTEEDDEEYSSQDVLRKQSDGIHEIGLEEAVGDIARRKIILERTESSNSLVSTMSVDSDWSDEEREKLEKIFGAMSERGKECAKMRHMRRSFHRSMRKGANDGAESISAPSNSTLSWDGAMLVFSRENSLSELTPSLLSSSL